MEERESTRAHLDAGSERVLLNATAPGYWSEEVDWRRGDGFEIRLRAFRTGMVRGGLGQTRQRSVPSRLWAEFEGSPEAPPPRAPRGRVQCPVVDTRWNCEVPAGVLDLRIGEDGYVPGYYWGIEVAPAKPSSLPALPVRQASSVVGFLFERDGRAPARGCRVELTTREGAEIPTRDRVPFASTTNDRGFFQIVAPLAGEYQLSVNAGARGSVTLPMELIENRERRIPMALVLEEPNVIDLSIQPPLDTKGRPWRVDVVDKGRMPARDVLSRTLDRSGRAKLPVPGTRLLMFVLDADRQQWASTLVETPPSYQVVEIAIPLRWVRGTVTLGGRPLRSRLKFSSRAGASVTLEASADGTFAGSLPEAERFDVDVSADDPTVRRNLVNVSIPASDELTLSLPDTLLRGRVVDEQRRPQPASIVTVRSMEVGAAEGGVQARSDDSGSFEIRGLEPGHVTASAETPSRRQSDLYEAQLREGAAIQVELVAREKVILTGRLVSETTGEPVPGARIKAIPSSASIEQAGIGRTTQTDPDGRFELRLVAGTREVDVVVMGLGHALTMERLAVEPGKPIVLRVPDVSGTLLVEFDRAWDMRDRSAPAIALLHRSARESLAYLLRSWGEPNGSVIDADPVTRAILPKMAPGEYRVCATALGALRQGRFPPERCSQGVVPAGGELTLPISLPSP